MALCALYKISLTGLSTVCNATLTVTPRLAIGTVVPPACAQLICTLVTG